MESREFSEYQARIDWLQANFINYDSDWLSSRVAAEGTEMGVTWANRAKGWFRVMYWDALLSMVVYTLATAAFYILGAAILHGRGDRVLLHHAHDVRVHLRTGPTLGAQRFRHQHPRADLARDQQQRVGPERGQHGGHDGHQQSADRGHEPWGQQTFDRYRVTLLVESIEEVAEARRQAQSPR